METLNFGSVLRYLHELLPLFDDNERYLISMDIEQWRSIEKVLVR